jgi:hypothetical protein
MWSVEAG